MRILIDIGHPAHVHYFKNLYRTLIPEHEVTITCKSVPIIKQLLEAYQMPYIELGKKGSGLAGKIFKQLSFNWRVFNILKSKKIDLAIGVSLSIIYASIFTKAKSIFIVDDDKSAIKLIGKYAAPFADAVLSPDVLAYEASKNCFYYPGYHELAYLHPKVFHPNQDVLKKYGLESDERFFILRFTSQKAHHDINETGLGHAQKKILIETLKKHGRVIINAESGSKTGFEEYELPIQAEEMHDLLYYAHMLVSDSQTMTSEAAVLGTPAFRCNSFVGRISYLEEEEKRYALTFGYLPRQFAWMMDNIKKHLDMPDLKNIWKTRRDKMIEDKIDVTAFWAWFITNYPESEKTLKKAEFSFENFSW